MMQASGGCNNPIRALCAYVYCSAPTRRGGWRPDVSGRYSGTPFATDTMGKAFANTAGRINLEESKDRRIQD
jgi:hypothetical protein